MQPPLSRALAIYIAALLLVTSVRPTSADVVWLVGSEQPLFGIVESESSDTVVFRRLGDATARSITISRSKVESIVVNHDTARLASLRPAKLIDYFEYAEELIPQKRDPTARNLAVRLLVIVAAASKNKQLQRNSLDYLVLLARSQDEKANFETLRYIETGSEPHRFGEPLIDQSPPEEQRAEIAGLVQKVRQRKPLGNLARYAKLKPAVDFYSSVCSWDELVLIATSNRIDNRQLAKLVALERRLREAPNKVSSSKNIPAETWDVLSRRLSATKLVIPTIETVTEFDPSKAVFTGGQWLTAAALEGSDENSRR